MLRYFPGTQGGPLEHVIGAKAVAFGEAMTDEFKQYMIRVKANAKLMSELFLEKRIQYCIRWHR